MEDDEVIKKLRTLESLFPDTDPGFLHQKVLEIGDDDLKFNQWIEEFIENNSAKDFPKKGVVKEPIKPPPQGPSTSKQPKTLNDLMKFINIISSPAKKSSNSKKIFKSSAKRYQCAKCNVMFYKFEILKQHFVTVHRMIEFKDIAEEDIQTNTVGITTGNIFSKTMFFT